MLFKRSFILFAGNTLNTLISGIFGIYVTRILGPGDKGVLTIALSTCGLMSMLFSFGVPYSSAYYIRSHPGCNSFILAQANLTMIVCALLSFALILLGKDIFSSLFLGGETIDAFMTAILIGMVIVNSGNTIMGATLVAQGDSHGYTMSAIMGTLIQIVSIILLLSLSQNNLHAVLLGTLLGAIGTAFLMRNRCYQFAMVEVGVSQTVTHRRFFTYGAQAQAGALASLLFKRVDLYIISYFINTSAVGFYSVGVGLRDLAMTASSAFAGLAGGEMADPRNKSSGRAEKIFKKGIYFNIVISFFMFLMSLLIFPYFIPIAYGEAFQKSVNVSIIIMGSLLPLSISLLIGKTIQSKGKPLLQSVSNVIGAVICTIVVWQCTKYFGILGAASATIVDSIVVLFLGWLFLRLSETKKNQLFKKI